MGALDSPTPTPECLGTGVEAGRIPRKGPLLGTPRCSAQCSGERRGVRPHATGLPGRAVGADVLQQAQGHPIARCTGRGGLVCAHRHGGSGVLTATVSVGAQPTVTSHPSWDIFAGLKSHRMIRDGVRTAKNSKASMMVPGNMKGTVKALYLGEPNTTEGKTTTQALGASPSDSKGRAEGGRQGHQPNSRSRDCQSSGKP